VLVARGVDALSETAQALRRTGVKVLTVAADITTPEGRAAALAAAADLVHAQAAAYDIVVTNAGGPPPGDFRDLDIAAWQEALNANMLTPIELMRATVDGMMTRRWGRIVNITSTAVKAPSPYLALSNGARSGLTRVHGRAGPAGGAAWRHRQQPAAGHVRHRSARRQPAGRSGTGRPAARGLHHHPPGRRFRRFASATPTNSARHVPFLCSPAPGYITGQNLLIDGGAYPGVF
jgi:3-oxoacyl-[acyl-carrier protein] reductase